MLSYAAIIPKQMVFTLQEVEVKYLLLGVVVTFVLTTFMFALMTSAAYAELREWVGRGKSGGSD